MIADIDDLIKEGLFLGFEEIERLVDHESLGVGSENSSRFSEEGKE